MLAAWQVFAQPIFDTVESHLKAYRIRKQQAAAASGAGAAAAAALERKSAGESPSAGKEADAAVAAGAVLAVQPSPFDTAPSQPGAQLAPGAAATANPLFAPAGSAALQAAEAGGAASGALTGLGSGEARLGSCVLGTAPLMSVRFTESGLAVANSAPIPTLLPPGGERVTGALLCPLLRPPHARTSASASASAAAALTLRHPVHPFTCPPRCPPACLAFAVPCRLAPRGVVCAATLQRARGGGGGRSQRQLLSGCQVGGGRVGG